MVRGFSNAEGFFLFFLISFFVVFLFTEKYSFIILFSFETLICVTSSGPLAVKYKVQVFCFIIHVYSAEDVNLHFI